MSFVTGTIYRATGNERDREKERCKVISLTNHYKTRVNDDRARARTTGLFCSCDWVTRNETASVPLFRITESPRGVSRESLCKIESVWARFDAPSPLQFLRRSNFALCREISNPRTKQPRLSSVHVYCEIESARAISLRTLHPSRRELRSSMDSSVEESFVSSK